MALVSGMTGLGGLHSSAPWTPAQICLSLLSLRGAGACLGLLQTREVGEKVLGSRNLLPL